MKDTSHVEYEFVMMTSCHNVITNNELFNQFVPQEKMRPFVTNVMHETFCLHVWNLLNYGIKKNLLHKDAKVEKILKRIKDQIITLTNNRTVVYEEKIQIPDDYAEMIQLANRVWSGGGK